MNPFMFTNVDMTMMNNFSRLHLIAKFRFFYISYIEKIFADIIIYVILRYIRRVVFDHSIMYDETLGDSIRGYSLFALKFYSYIHGNAVDGFVLQAINDHEGSFMQICLLRFQSSHIHNKL